MSGSAPAIVPAITIPEISDRPLKMSIFDQLTCSMAIKQLDVDKFRVALIRIIGVQGLDLQNDQVLAICHQARLKLVTATSREKLDSEDWLRFRNLL